VRVCGFVCAGVSSAENDGAGSGRKQEKGRSELGVVDLLDGKRRQANFGE
jgi:hypothetical protein